jgi:hypothetical protein
MTRPKPNRRTQTLKDLQDLQRLAAGMIMRPLGRGMHTDKTWTDGQPTAAVAATFIKPNDRLTSFERIEIYNRQYWFRVIDCMHEDYPGLRTVLGQRAFNRLILGYLEKYPSRSFTLRNLGDRLAQFIHERPELIDPNRRQLAFDIARFEWAQVVAFDGPELPPLGVDDLLGKDPNKLRLGLQPYITLLDLQYPLDDYTIALKKQASALRSEASNAVETPDEERSTDPTPRLKSPKRQRCFVAVHRQDNELYFKRLTQPEFTLLSNLRDGTTLARACDSAVHGADPKVDWSTRIHEWFQTWTRMGWFCKRPVASSNRKRS